MERKKSVSIQNNGRGNHHLNHLHRRIAELESGSTLPPSEMEQFRGYGIPAITFESGHILALRRFPESSLGPAYTSVWHRNARGVWRFYTDTHPLLSCSRYFGSRLQSTIQTTINMSWCDAYTLQIELPEHGLQWDISIQSIPVNRLATLLLRQIPNTWKSRPEFLRRLSRLATKVWEAGECQLTGEAPNGQEFRIYVDGIWAIRKCRAWWHSANLGNPAPLPRQASLGDFMMPQRGYFVTGQSWFQAYDPMKHDLKLHQFDMTLDGSMESRPSSFSEDWIMA